MTRRRLKPRMKGVYRSRKVVVQPPPPPRGPALGWPPEDVRGREGNASEKAEG